MSKPFVSSFAVPRSKRDHHRTGHGYESSSTLMSSDIETTSFFDSTDDDSR